MLRQSVRFLAMEGAAGEDDENDIAVDLLDKPGTGAMEPEDLGLSADDVVDE